MKKKMLLIVAMIALMFYVPNVSAKELEVKDSTSLKTLFDDAETGDVIKLVDNIDFENHITLTDGRKLTIDLNGYNLKSVNDKTVLVYDGNLTFTGKGIVELGTQQINVWGSDEKNDKDFSVLTINKDVTITSKGTGIGIYVGNKYGYGIKVTIAGKITAVDFGVTIFGTLQNVNGPVVNILDGAVIKSTEASGIYAAGNGEWTLGNITVEGVETAIGIKSGKMTINGGTYTCTGKKVLPVEGYSSGINASGATIQIESNDSYYKNINLIINDGKFVSKNASVLLEYLGQEVDEETNEVVDLATDTAINNIEINGGVFVPNEEEPTFVVSEELNAKIPQFITGGEYTSDVSSMVKAGYKSYLTEDGISKVEKISVPTGKYTLAGVIKGVSNTATVQLKQGSKVLQIVKIDNKGNYEFKNLEKGTYTLVIVDEFTSNTRLVNVKDELTTVDVEVTGAGSRVVFVGSEDLDLAVEGLEKVDENNEVVLIVGKVSEDKEDEEQQTIKKEIKSDNYEFLGFEVLVDDTLLEETNNVLMLAIPYDFKDKENFTVSRYHNGKVDKFTELDKIMPEYKDGTFYADKDNKVLYVFTSKFSTYAVSYDKTNQNNEVINTPDNNEVVESPKTGDTIYTSILISLISVIALVVSITYIKRKVNA